MALHFEPREYKSRIRDSQKNLKGTTIEGSYCTGSGKGVSLKVRR